MATILCLFFLLVAINGAQYQRELDMVEFLPGQPPVSFRQYAGYVTVNENAGRALFYYFVEAEDDPHLKPLTLWLNGGPGCSSVGTGAFTELGPFFPDSSGTGLIRNHYAWNRATNILFVESPAGVGWSYSNRSDDYWSFDDNKTAEDMIIFLVNWMERFPEFQDRDFFLSGESYAGHYVPQLATAIVKYSEDPKHFFFNLKGIIIGNPSLNLAIDKWSTYLYHWSHGLVSDKTFQGLSKWCNWETLEGIECEHFVEQATREIGPYINGYDVLADVCINPINRQIILMKQFIMGTKFEFNADACVFEEMTHYLNLPEVQRALHSNTTGLPYRWKFCEEGILQYAKKDAQNDIIPVIGFLLQNGLRVWIYSGDNDSVVPLIGTRKIVNMIASNLKLKPTLQYAAWYHLKQVGGWSQAYGNLTYATVRGASHMVPYGQPSRGLALFQSFLEGVPLPSKP